MKPETQYLATVNYSITVKDVVLLTPETELAPATYQVTHKPIDLNEDGALLPVEVDFYLCDYAGHRYRFISVNGNEGIVEDVLRCHVGPCVEMTGIIYKSVGSGVAPFIAPINYSLLDRTAKDYGEKIDNDIQWKYPNNVNIKWHQEGLSFTSDPADRKIVTYTAGSLSHHLWYLLSRYKVLEVVGRINYHPERFWTFAGNTITLASTAKHYIYGKIPYAEEVTTGEIVIATDYRHEHYYEGYILILLGVYESPDFTMLYGGVSSGGAGETHPPVTIDPASADKATIGADQILYLTPLGFATFDLPFEFCVSAGISQIFTIDLYAVYPYTINSLIAESDGTLSAVAAKIDGVSITGLSSVSVSTLAVVDSTSGNAVVLGNRVTLVTSVTYSGFPTYIRGKLKITRA
jgi:hypothetical protein